MNISLEGKQKNIAVITGEGIIIGNAQDALDLIATAWHEHGCGAVAIARGALGPDFFELRSGLAGEVLQKFVNYRMRLAIVGDFSDFSHGPMHDFIYESNRGGHILFVPTLMQAIERLDASAGK